MKNNINAVELAVELTAAWLANPSTRTHLEDVPAFLQSMYMALLQLSGAADIRSSQNAD